MLYKKGWQEGPVTEGTEKMRESVPMTDGPLQRSLVWKSLWTLTENRGDQ